jgi:aerotaxis receptor
MDTNLVPIEHELGEDEYLITRNDADAKITYVNGRLPHVTGYARAELIGAPTSMLYHPDMPTEVGADVWRTLRRDGAWTGLMKHRCKDGGSFWAVATVTPNVHGGHVVGYTSVRTRATPQQVQRAERAYAELKSGHTRRYALRRGRIVERGLHGWISALTSPAARRLLVCAGSSGIGMAFAASLWFGTGAAALMLMTSPEHIGLLLALTLGGLAGGAWGHWRIRRAAILPLRQALGAVRLFAAGDLSVAVPQPVAHNEVGELSYSLGVMQKSLALAVRDVRHGIRSSTEAAGEIATANEDLSSRTEQQAASLEQTAATVEELVQTVRSNMDSTGDAHRRAQQAVLLAADGRNAAAQAVNTMRELTERARLVAGVSSTIEAIAFQTNILALNASVEAARAGSEGRGFAVVASEVRALALRSSGAAKEISVLIAAALDQIEIGARQVFTSGQVIDRLVAAVDEVGAIVATIAQATREQSAGVEQVGTVVAQLDDMTQRTAAMVEQAAAAAHALLEQTRDLEIAMATFRLTRAEN